MRRWCRRWPGGTFPGSSWSGETGGSTRGVEGNEARGRPFPFHANSLPLVDYTLASRMKCFYHPGSDAVGVCKSCGKGLCPDCVADLGKGIACRSRCETDVEIIIGLIEQSPHSVRWSGALVLVLGLILIAAALMGYGMGLFPYVLGTLCVVYGLFAVMRSLRLGRGAAPRSR